MDTSLQINPTSTPYHAVVAPTAHPMSSWEANKRRFYVIEDWCSLNTTFKVVMWILSIGSIGIIPLLIYGGSELWDWYHRPLSTEERISSASRYLNALRNCSRFSGVVLIGVGDRIVSQEIFQPRGVRQKTIDRSMPWNVQSLGKKFTEIAIMQLIEQRRINLDTRIRDILTPEDITLLGLEERDRLHLDDREPFLNSDVTIKDLLRHESGLVDSPRAPARFVSRERGQSLYSNTGFAILGIVVEKLTGKPFKEYVGECIFRPLGLRSSLGFIQEPPRQSDVAEHFESGSITGEIRHTDAFCIPPHGYGCFWMMPAEMHQFVLAFDRGTLFRERNTLTRLQSEVYRQSPLCFHGRDMGASSTFVVMHQRDFPDETIVALAFSNFTDGDCIGPDLERALRGEVVIPFEEQQKAITFYQSFLHAETIEARESLLRDFLSSNPDGGLLTDICVEFYQRGRRDLFIELAAALPRDIRTQMHEFLSNTPELQEMAEFVPMA